MRVAISIVALLVLARPAEADELKSKATFAIELEADGVPAWHVDAVARTLTADLVGERLLVPGDTPAELVMHGALGRDELRYEVALPDRPARRGAIGLAGLDRLELAQAVRDVLHRVLDKRDAPASAYHPARLPAPGSPLGVLLGLGAAALLLLAPSLLLRARPGLRTLLYVATLGAIAAALLLAGDRVSGASWAILVGGGLAWGAFVAVTVPIVFPPLPGLERIDPDELLPVLRAWTVRVLQRLALVVLFYAPFMAALAGFCVAFDVPALAGVGVLAPAWALAIRHALETAVVLLARGLDEQLVDGPATADNVWHVAARGYLRGYLKRAGWSGDPRLVDDLLILPGKADEILLYGGGQTHPRIVVARAWLELALAPYGRPHDYAAPRVSTLEWNEWNAGLVVPTEVGAVIATREQRQPREPEPPGTYDETEHVPFGEPPTLAGYVEPDALDKRSAHRPEEDPLWLDYDPGDEPDGTDPSDKDFLFGALIEQLGRIQRHDDRLATLALALRGGRLERVVVRAGRVLARQAAVIDDIHASLNHARHHRVQFLAWRQTRDDAQLTARAYPPELEDRAAQLLPGLAPGLAPFYRAGAPSRRAIWLRRAALAGLVLTGLAFAASAAIDAIDYGPTYAERMQEKHDGKEE